uniref:Uncharacterized protein n=1 Tax=Amphimedon queenslandica TaxID=400682 RepID=A0A1X7V2A7_AMPQE
MESSSNCLGCGSSNVPAYNRRKLSSEVSGAVKDAWKSALVDEYGDYISVAAGDDDTIIAVLKESGGYKCRPCFTTFERFHSLKCRISDSIKGLDDKITAVPFIRHNTMLRRIESHLSNAFLDHYDNESMSTDDSDIDFSDTVDGDRGDNLDLNIQPRFMGVNRYEKHSPHLFDSFAAADRIDTSAMSDTHIVPNHIQHDYGLQMSQKTEVVPFGMLAK